MKLMSGIRTTQKAFPKTKIGEGNLQEWFAQSGQLKHYENVFSPENPKNSNEKITQHEILRSRLELWVESINKAKPRSDAAGKHSSPIKVLDIGCGSGMLTLKLLGSVGDRTGAQFAVDYLDASEYSLKAFENKSKDTAAVILGERLETAWGEFKIGSKKSSYDLVIADHSFYIEKINQRNVLRALDLLSPQGLLIIIMMSEDSDIYRIRKFCRIEGRQNNTSEKILSILTKRKLFYERIRYQSKLYVNHGSEESLKLFIFVVNSLSEIEHSWEIILDDLRRFEGNVQYFRNVADIFVLDRTQLDRTNAINQRISKISRTLSMQGNIQEYIIPERAPLISNASAQLEDQENGQIKEYEEQNEFGQFLEYSGIVESSSGYKNRIQNKWVVLQSRSLVTSNENLGFLVIPLTLPVQEYEAYDGPDIVRANYLASRKIQAGTPLSEALDYCEKSQKETTNDILEFISNKRVLRDQTELEQYLAVGYRKCGEYLCDSIAYLLEELQDSVIRQPKSYEKEIQILDDLSLGIHSCVNIPQDKFAHTHRFERLIKFVANNKKTMAMKFYGAPDEMKAFFRKCREIKKQIEARNHAIDLGLFHEFCECLLSSINKRAYRYGIYPRTTNFVSKGIDENLSVLSFQLDENTYAFASLWGMGILEEGKLREDGIYDELRNRIYEIIKVLSPVYAYNLSRYWTKKSEELTRTLVTQNILTCMSHAIKKYSNAIEFLLDRYLAGETAIDLLVVRGKSKEINSIVRTFDDMDRPEKVKKVIGDNTIAVEGFINNIERTIRDTLEYCRLSSATTYNPANAKVCLINGEGLLIPVVSEIDNEIKKKKVYYHPGLTQILLDEVMLNIYRHTICPSDVTQQTINNYAKIVIENKKIDSIHMTIINKGNKNEFDRIEAKWNEAKKGEIADPNSETSRGLFLNAQLTSLLGLQANLELDKEKSLIKFLIEIPMAD